VLEDLVTQGKIRWYGWSTDDPAGARVFAHGAHCAAIQHDLNFIECNDEMLAVCDQHDLASINRNPLMMGLLTGKFQADSILPEDDVRRPWNFREGPAASVIQKLEKVRQVLTQEGHALAQAALVWIWTYHLRTIPIPGFKTTKQVEEDAAAMLQSLLTREQMTEIDALLNIT
jgi:aryl-alcohol dehydrogenase-like predicted oxidoreductase